MCANIWNSIIYRRVFRFCLSPESRDKTKPISEKFEKVIFGFMLKSICQELELFNSVMSCFRKYGMPYVRNVYVSGIKVISLLAGKLDI